ncbi:MAG: hypothetical protein QOH36_99 [Actinomycetota bacterium]|jgi:hypothetical protein|nr:hypothetical protein [Actinomycetota bacterium]MEA2973128.1 hypothetical protein [Actinomycetota bacterium]
MVSCIRGVVKSAEKAGITTLGVIQTGGAAAGRA